MLPFTSMETSARVFCEVEWCGVRGESREPMRMQMCPVSWLLPEVLALVSEHRDRPVHELEPTIRRLIEEQDFFEDAGDSMIAERRGELVEEYVRMFVKALERVREEALRHGEWSNLPVTPQMFG